MTDQWMENQSRDGDWSKDEKPVMYGDDLLMDGNDRWT